MKSCPCKHRDAFTLMEVVVGLTLMASVLVSSLLAFSAHQKQRRTADAKLAAVAIADDLLSRFSSLQEGIPDASRGSVPGRNGWFWRTEVVGTATPAGVPVRVIRLEVLGLNPQGAMRKFVSVDVVKGMDP